jgi:predicted signal transduction protein with EAL and GGDEF domain
LREVVQQRLPLTISAGLGVASKGDSPQTLLSRADSALYSAKAAGRNRVFRHDGIDIEAVTTEAAAAEATLNAAIEVLAIANSGQPVLANVPADDGTFEGGEDSLPFTAVDLPSLEAQTDCSATK